MSKTAIVFPGQGAQFLGMGRDLAERYPEARDVFDRADAALAGDLALSTICFEGPEDRVNATDVCQPGILVTSLATLAVLERHKGLDASTIACTAGLSLGEYTALVFAGALAFEDAVRLVRKRGRYMLDASEAAPSGMLSLMGADRAQAEAIAAEAAPAGVIAVANLNAPGQVVLSGANAALDAAEVAAKAAGIRRAIRLVVSGAFHSPLMQPAADRLAADLAAVEVRAPRCPVYSNVTAEPVGSPDDIRELLARQVVSPVRWADSVGAMLAAGTTRFIEPGPNKVLTGLLKKIDRDATGIAVPDVDAVEAFTLDA